MTVLEGTNRSVMVEGLAKEVAEVLGGRAKRGKAPELWDGRAAERIVKVLESLLLSADFAD